jgi:SNF2 family DNA or RNA helicase
MGGYGGYQVTGYRNQDELNKKFYSIAIRVEENVLELPPVVEEERYCVLSHKAQVMYDNLENNLITLVGKGMVTAANGLTLLLRLQQMTGGWLAPDVDLMNPEKRPEQVDDGKMKLLADVLEDIALDEPVVVFCRFVQDLATVRSVARVQKRTSFELSGRYKELEQWKNDTTGSVFAVQIQSGGLGIDLTRAHYCVYYSVGFSLGEYEQSQARVHRPGQKETVTYIKLIVRNTVDEKVYKALVEKKNVVEAVLAEIKDENIRITEAEDMDGVEETDGEGT